MTNDREEQQYSLSLAGKGLTVKRNVSEKVANQIVNLVMLGTTPATDEVGALGREERRGDLDGTPTPKNFVAAKRPASDMERVACLAYYLNRYRGVASFKTNELTKLNSDASQPTFSNIAASARNAVQQDFLTLAGGGKKQITVRGEALVEALPDRSKVKEALEGHPLRRRRRKGQRSPKGKK